MIDEKFLKYFDSKNFIDFYQPTERSAVVVTEDGKLCAIIMPIVKSEVK